MSLIYIAWCSTGLAGAQISFENRSVDSGIASVASATGVSTVDFDLDGIPDATFSLSAGGVRLLRGLGDGTFVDVTQAWSVPDLPPRSSSPLWADFTGDGLPDLVVSSMQEGGSRLLVREGDRLVDRSSAMGFEVDQTISTMSAADFDGDGWIDLYAGTHNSQDYLFRNTGGVFVDVAGELGVGGVPGTIPMQMAWVDYDRDQDLDLFVTHDSQDPNLMYRNRGDATFEEVAAAIGVEDIGLGNAMGLAWGDIDADGYPDAYSTRIWLGGLFVNDGAGAFKEEATDRGAWENAFSWGVVFADFDLDADEDIYFVSSSALGLPRPPQLFVNEGGVFSWEQNATTLEFFTAYGLAKLDADGDGLMDLIMTRAGAPSQLMINTTPTQGNWVSIEVKTAQGHPAPPQTRVDVYTPTRHFTQSVSGGDSYRSQQSGTLHFGFSNESRIDSVRVWMPHGSSWVEEGLPLNQKHVVLEPATIVQREREEVPSAEIPLAVYPNPCTGTCHIDGADNGRWSLFNVLGRQVHTGTDRYLDASDLPAGIYVLVVGQQRTLFAIR